MCYAILSTCAQELVCVPERIYNTVAVKKRVVYTFTFVRDVCYRIVDLLGESIWCSGVAHWHGAVAKAAPQSDECGEILAFLIQMDLMVTAEGISYGFVSVFRNRVDCIKRWAGVVCFAQACVVEVLVVSCLA